MSILAEIPHYGFWFLALLTVLVFVHEYGHYIVARWCGVKVEVFSIGFGPELFGWTDSRSTRWKISAIPLGGYVKMFGQGANLLEGEAGKAMTESDRRVAFDYKSVWRRMAIVAADNTEAREILLTARSRRQLFRCDAQAIFVLRSDAELKRRARTLDSNAGDLVLFGFGELIDL